MPVVVKLGGSLLDLPQLGPRLRAWLDALPTAEIILILGGGPAADSVRRADQVHHLGDEQSHWLALRAMSFNSHLVAALLPRSDVVAALHECSTLWEKRRTPILDPLPLIQENRADPLMPPSSWTATSDSIAAYVAHLADAELILLKSRSVPDRFQDAGAVSWGELAKAGLVDEYFPRLAGLLRSIRLINFREEAGRL